MDILGYRVIASRWPWQKRDRSWSTPDNAPANWGWSLDSKTHGMGRFGGGWDWKLGITKGGGEAIIDLVIGSIRMTSLHDLACRGWVKAAGEMKTRDFVCLGSEIRFLSDSNFCLGDANASY